MSFFRKWSGIIRIYFSLKPLNMYPNFISPYLNIIFIVLDYDITLWIYTLIVVSRCVVWIFIRKELSSHPADNSTPACPPYRELGSPGTAPACPAPRVVDLGTWWVPMSGQQHTRLIQKHIVLAFEVEHFLQNPLSCFGKFLNLLYNLGSWHKTGTKDVW